MKKTILSTFVVATVAGLGLFVGTTQGQAPREAEAMPHKVGLIDMAEVFKNYEKFKTETEALKEEVRATTDQMKAVAEKVKGLQGEMQELKQGAPRRNEIEKEILKYQAQLQLLRTQTQVDLARKEAAIYKEIYEEVQGAVEKYAGYYKYTLVLRYSSEELDEELPPQAVIQKLNQLVVYRRADDDITPAIVAYLNRKFNGGGGTPGN